MLGSLGSTGTKGTQGYGRIWVGMIGDLLFSYIFEPGTLQHSLISMIIQGHRRATVGKGWGIG